MEYDYTTAQGLSNALIKQSTVIGSLAEDVGKARTILEYSSDRRKRALALAFADAMKAGAGSAAAAEHAARASTSYRDALDAQERQDNDAEQIVAQWQAEQTKFEALRTACSLAKTIAGQI